MDLHSSPFSALSLIVAPAVLTNACSVLALSTSNRLARAVDRAREIHRELHDPPSVPQFEVSFMWKELRATHRRVLMLIRALSFFYSALGGFAGCALLSVLGATLFSHVSDGVLKLLEGLAVVVGSAAICALIAGISLIVRETKVVVEVLDEQAKAIEARMSHS